MKAILLLGALAAVFSVLAEAEEFKKHSLGLGIAGASNFIDTAAAGGIFSYEYSITESVAAGGRLGVKYTVGENFSLEPEALVRWYYYRPSWAACFVQWDMGMDLGIHDSAVDSGFMVGLSLGMRFFFGSFYVEPLIRGGYPFLAGLGVMGGYRL
jgi:hypothetical protein